MAKGKELTSYFPHDSNARNSDKIIRLRMRHKSAGYGVYFMILERLRDEPDYMSVKDYNMIAFDLREDASLIKSVVEDFGLFVFTEDGKYFYSESFMRRMKIKDETIKKRSEAGKVGSGKRWTKNNEIANATENDSKTITDAIKIDNKAITNATENDNKKSKVNKKKISSVEDIKESPPSASPVALYPLEEIQTLLPRQPIWVEAMCREFGISLPQLSKFIDSYIQELKLSGVTAKTLPDAMAHCRNLMRKRRQLEKTPGGAPAKSWRQQFTELAVEKFNTPDDDNENEKPFWL